jgi:putative MATE family efflux protein
MRRSEKEYKLIKSSDYLVKKVFKSYFTVSVVSILAMSLGTTVDSLVAGNLIGENVLAALGIASPIIVFLSTISGILGSGALALCTVFIGEEKPERVNPVFTAATLMCLFFSLVIAVLCMVVPEAIAALLGAKGELLTPAADYIFGLSFGCIFVSGSFIMLNFVRMDGSKNLPMYSISSMTLVNIGLDFLVAGPLRMGAFGLALATSISYVVSLGVCLTHFLHKENTLRFVSMKGAGEDIKRIFHLGAPNALNRFSHVGRALFLNHMLAFLGGAAAVAAFTVQNTVNSIVAAIPQGAGQTLTFAEGIFYGERDRRYLRRTLTIAIRYGGVICLGMVVVLVLLASPITQLFGFDAATSGTAAMAVRYLAIALPFTVITEVLVSFYQSVHNVKMSNFVAIAHYVGFLIPAVFALTPFMGLNGVWLGTVVSELLTIAAIYCIVWIRKRSLSNSADDLMMLPDDFDTDPADAMEFSIGGEVDKTAEASEQVRLFAQTHALKKREQYAFALPTEELGNNVIRQVFGQNPGNRTFDIRIAIADEGIIFRLRDDGSAFNPVAFVESISNAEADAASNIGIRMALAMAENVDYRYTLEMNILTMHFKRSK